VMLANGLGDVINREIPRAKRFCDLFLGTGEVASFVARKYPMHVYGVDLQSYSVVLTEAIVGRCSILPWTQIWETWLERARARASEYKPPYLPSAGPTTKKLVQEMRTWCAERITLPLTSAYGGHYFSPSQGIWIDALRATLPEDNTSKTVALAALIHAASHCAASPGHTAQPFQPTRTAARYLKEAWLRDPLSRVAKYLKILSAQHARTPGAARVADANEVAGYLGEGDLVFLDPPYSGVQYSRFYHVLESIARGRPGEVTGIGRYPDQAFRPKSSYSLVTESEEALNQLLFLLSTTGASAILTFPDHACSNGLSGNSVREIARAHFKVRENSVKSKFSTLGGRGSGKHKVARREARHDASELILLLRPK